MLASPSAEFLHLVPLPSSGRLGPQFRCLTDLFSVTLILPAVVTGNLSPLFPKHRRVIARLPLLLLARTLHHRTFLLFLLSPSFCPQETWEWHHQLTIQIPPFEAPPRIATVALQ